MAKESTQHKLDRVRKPRVQITYDVEVGGATTQKELPFVVGVLGDFSGQPAEPLAPMAKRDFVNVDRDNFNAIMAGMKPRLAFKVDNKLTDDGSKLGVELNFSKLEDFDPEQVVRQAEPLRKLLEARQKLSDLVHKIDGNEKLEETLQEIISSSETLKKVGQAAGIEVKDEKEGSNG